jgi:hypothetical protein
MRQPCGREHAVAEEHRWGTTGVALQAARSQATSGRRSKCRIYCGRAGRRSILTCRTSSGGRGRGVRIYCGRQGRSPSAMTALTAYDPARR